MTVELPMTALVERVHAGHRALLIVDVQNTFVHPDSLSVPSAMRRRSRSSAWPSVAQLGGDRSSSYYAGMLDAPDWFTSLGEADAWFRQWTLYEKLPTSGMAIVLREHLEEASDASWRWRYMHKLRAAQRRVPRETLFPPQWAVLPQVGCPVLILHGTRSESLLPDVAMRTREALPRATLVPIPDCSHFPFLEAPEAFIPLLARFLEDNGETECRESDV